jgi:lysozyme family protein
MEERSYAWEEGALDAVAFRLESADEWRIRQNATINC